METVIIIQHQPTINLDCQNFFEKVYFYMSAVTSKWSIV